MRKKLLKLYSVLGKLDFEDELSKYDKKNKILNSKNLINFRKKLILSKGFDESDNKKLGLSSYKNLSNNNFIELTKLKIPNIGNSNHLLEFKKKINSKIYKLKTDSQIIYDYYLFTLFKDKINLNKKNNILAIGEGFGSFCCIIAKYILSKKNKFKFVIYELPLQNLLIFYFLKKIFPSRKILTIENIKNKKLSLNVFNKYDFLILTPDIKLDKKIKFDLIYSKMALMNMSKISIKNYFAIINEHLKNEKYLFLVNKYSKKDFRIYKILKYLIKFKFILSLNIKIRINQHLLLLKKNSNSFLKFIIEFFKIFLITIKLKIKNILNFN